MPINMIIYIIIVAIINSVVYNNISRVVNVGIGGLIVSDINNLLKEAINETSNLHNGEVFLLRDLFKGYEWNRIAKSTRLLLGTLFLNKVISENLEIETNIKTSSGQQKYQIVRRSNNA